MPPFLGTIIKFFTGDVIGRVFDVVNKNIESKTDREKLKADVVKTWLQNRTSMPWYVDFCFIGPLGFYWAFVIIYSMFWHQNGMWPQTWDIAALPYPLDKWAGWIVASRFGIAAVQHFVARK
ncbi:MAG: hypothetical protein COB36_12355 [Alphaproteobacteria bacterium]|nr:MAG: hypothetical protein COB36_12355 [Alphaproteobacteria bacterium]